MFYILILLALLGAGVGVFPIPEEIIVLSAGAGIQQELGGAAAVFLIVFAGIIFGDFILFWLGRKYGEKMFKVKLFSFFLPRKNVEKVQRVFNGHGRKLIFTARFISGLRAVVFFTAGMSGIKPKLFILIDAFANCIYIPFFLFLGYRFSYDISRLVKGFTKIYHMIELVVILAIVGWFVFRLSKKVLNPLKEKLSNNNFKSPQ